MNCTQLMSISFLTALVTISLSAMQYKSNIYGKKQEYIKALKEYTKIAQADPTLSKLPKEKFDKLVSKCALGEVCARFNENTNKSNRLYCRF